MDNQILKPSEVAELFGFDGIRRIDQLVQDGVLNPVLMKERGKEVRRYKLVETVQEYIDYLADKAYNRTPASADMAEAIAAADLRYKEARAGKMELELMELEGTMHRAEDVEAVTNDMITSLRAAFLALPGRLAVDTADAKTAKETSAIIKAAVDEVLNDTAGYRYHAADYRKLVMEREKWISIQEAETVKQQKSTDKKKTASKKQPASSKGSARASKPRKT